DKVLPESPALVLEAAQRLEERPETSSQAAALYQRALALFADRPVSLGAQDLYRKARAHRALGQAEEALTAYRAALDEDPARGEWRYELAELLHRQRRLTEARRELTTLLASRPNDGKARELHDTVLREIAEGD